MSVNQVISSINPRSLSNNTQRVAYRLLRRQGEWVSINELKRVANSAASRVRDLRLPEFGGFDVECENARNLGKRGDHFFYRVSPRSVTKKAVSTVFRI